MSTEDYDYRAPDEIEGDIEHTRSEMRETLDAIQNRFTPGQMMDEVATYFRDGPGAFASNLGRIVRDNPIPVALVGAGLAWLAIAGSRRRPALDERAYDEPDYYYASAGGGDYAAATGAEYAAYTTTGGVHHPSAPGSAGSTVGAAYYGGGENGGSSYGGTASYDPYEEDRQGRVGRMTEGARHQMSRLGGAAREQGQRARAGFTEMVDEQPLLMAAAAFVLGAALGALLPSTRREDRLMGETRDDLAHRASEMGREGLHRAERTAEETWTAVSDEVLNPEASGGQAQSDTAASSTTRRSAAGGSSSSSSGRSNVKPGGAAGTTPSEGQKKKD